MGFPACCPNRAGFGYFLMVMASVTFRPNRKSSAAWMTIPSRAHVRGVVVVGEGKGVVGVQPAVVGMAAFVGSSDVQFGRCRFHINTIAALSDSLQC